MLKRMLTTLTGSADGYAVELLPNIYTLNVKLALTSKNAFNSVADMLNRVIPANLIFNVLIMYNQHITLQPFTHQQLHKYTHYGIRNEVLS